MPPNVGTQSSRASIRTGIFHLPGGQRFQLGSHLGWSELGRARFRHPCFRAYSFGTLRQCPRFTGGEKTPICVGAMSTKPNSAGGLLLTSLSSTASQPRSSRHSLPPGIQSGKEHGGTSGGSTRTCFCPECCPRHLRMGRSVSGASM